MTKAVESGMPKLRIEESAARRQARVDRGEDVVVGVNKYVPDDVELVDVLDIDNTKVREEQIAKLEQVRADRDDAACQAALDALTEGARGDGNLLALAVEAARARATVGEISDAMEDGVRPPPGRDPYASPACTARPTRATRTSPPSRATSRPSPRREGRRPRMLVVKMGQDGHDRGAKVIATAFADLGFDVDVGPLFQTPAEAARDAVENDVHVVGVSSQAAGHKTLVPQLIDELKAAGAGDVVVVVRRRHPAPGLRRALRGRRRRHLRPGHQHPRRRPPGARPSCSSVAARPDA